MASGQFAVRLEIAWQEPVGLPEPTAKQQADGIVVVMLVTMNGIATHRKGEHYLMDVPQATRLIEAGYARRESEREERIARAEGHKRGPGLKGSPAVEGKAKGKGKSKG